MWLHFQHAGCGTDESVVEQKESMVKIAFLFPGQGSQQIGMARDLFESDDYFRSLVDYASELTGENLNKLCLEGPDERLIKAWYLQPLLASVSLGYLRQLGRRGITADVICGHSLGEITALAAGGIVSDREMIAIATKRGELMDKAASGVNGGMMAVLFVAESRVEQILDELDEPDRIVLANDNGPHQAVVSGDNELLEEFAKRVANEPGGKCHRLVVSGPWHSPYIKHAQEEYEEWAKPIRFGRPRTPVIFNATAKTEEHPTTIKHLVTWQLTSPVYFRDCLARLKQLEVDTLVEVGPGRVLSGLARVNGFKKGYSLFNANSIANIERIVATLGSGS
ncbi:MAG: acyltransferase domain-containing protein, partial [Chitinivibrionales bacterium]|nr:acyltransferase domain-containing protein [Chitinivibrionales bacterium]MBD3356880.1 acyltransferase domain-containing protein [Chitinivibrionales bacterium]